MEEQRIPPTLLVAAASVEGGVLLFSAAERGALVAATAEGGVFTLPLDMKFGLGNG